MGWDCSPRDGVTRARGGEAASRACVAARRGGVTRVRGGETRRRHARAWRRDEAASRACVAARRRHARAWWRDEAAHLVEHFDRDSQLYVGWWLLLEPEPLLQLLCGGRRLLA